MPITIRHAGFCTPLGHDPSTILQALVTGDTSAMVSREGWLFDRPAIVGEVAMPLPSLPPALAKFSCRNNALLLQAVQPLRDVIAAAVKHYGADRIGIVLGTSTSGIANGEQALAYYQQHGRFPKDYHYEQQELGSPAEFLQQLLDLQGPAYTVSTACSSSAKVFASGRRLLLSGLCDLVLVGGVDSLSQLTLNGFDALESIDNSRCNPCSRNRHGINIGEGAAVFTLERGDGEILLGGCGESSDAYHISAPHPQGRGAIAAMQAALSQAGLTAADIDYVNLHGTATAKNDAMEALAMNSVFGADAIPPCSSTKPLVGHTLGAAGAIETAFCWLLLSHYNSAQLLPPHRWDGEIDEKLLPLPLVKKGDSARLQHLMSNSFAFGGSNASLILSRGNLHE
ncbi:beta-ketoacyl-[acyl-carrier-protein] synthase family protein [Shewanella yunxiaonensis]|uniref:Beta-ketoacyl-[acyl-carrier-protein] synthase family protein n=1 Tax=Shewanella yunxiaonensis TaxID=2829809 RepID=A0ABX7YTM6_9GAMM|nr:beta-ketoacyl-[acyl-carrier-protein] synthase family protein [Shewanella yunxiaonensis]QUN05720.1 beta-ketoacyl-[acyl-carrier-protein] synthase family protein [Shewanella yunxiaonensis]